MKITTIWWGNGQSNILDAFFRYFPENYEITSIVSMSDDGRTTWVLMREYKKAFHIHLPPPGDLRRCLFSLSQSPNRELYKILFETVLTSDNIVSSCTLKDLFELTYVQNLWENHSVENQNILKNFETILDEIRSYDTSLLEIKLPLEISLSGHKFGNILMAALFHNFWDFEKMVEVMNSLLQVRGKVLPVTTQSAYIQAVLENGEIIETQDNISNVCDYSSHIQRLELMQNSKDAKRAGNIDEVIQKSDYIILGPGDLFTSTIANLIIWWMKESLKNSKAKIVFILNNTNKWGETEWFSVMDFILHLERYIGRKIDILVANNKRLALAKSQKEKLQSDISVKWWEYIYLTENERFFLEWRQTHILEWDFIDRDTLYKHHKKYLCTALLELFSKE